MLWTYNQHNFAGGRLDKELMGRQDLTQYFKGASELRNFYVRRQGYLSKRRGTDFVADISGIVGQQFRIIPLVYSKSEGFYLIFSDGKVFVASRNGVLAANKTSWLETATDSTAFSLSSGMSNYEIAGFDFAQSGDTVYVVHPNHRPVKYTFDRPSLTLAREVIDFDVTVHDPPTVGGPAKKDMTGSGAKKNIKYVVTYVGQDDVESYPSEPATTWYYLPWPSGGTITVNAYSNGQAKPKRYNVYKNDGNGYGFIGSIESGDISDKTGKANYGELVDDYITPDMSNTPPERELRRTFSTKGNYPSVVTLYQQRLVLAGSRNDPFTFWMSKTGDLYDFSTHRSLREDDAITATLAATEQPEINHAVLCKDLMLFANSGEWEVAPISGNALSYKTVSAKMQSAIGAASWTKPLIVGSEIIFVDSTGERMLATHYNYASDGYESQELTVLSQWMFKSNPVRRAAYRPSPDSTIHCVMQDGSVATLVYMKEHEVCAWSRNDLGGGYFAEDVACSKALSGGSTEIMYVVSNRSSKNRVVELWRERDEVAVVGFCPIQNFICMDGCRSVPNGATVPQGMTAVDIRTGAVYGAGSAAGGYAVAGYRFVSKYESVYPDARSDGDGIQMEVMNPTEARVRVIDSSSFRIGAKANDSSYDRTVSVPVTTAGGAVTLSDKDARVVFVGTNTRDARVRITHDEPWPINVLSVAITYQIEKENQNASANG